MKNAAKTKGIWLFATVCLLTLVTVIAVCLFLGELTPLEIDISLAEAFLFRLPERDVVFFYSNDDCGSIRMQPFCMGGSTFWFTANNPMEDVEYLQNLYRKYGL